MGGGGEAHTLDCHRWKDSALKIGSGVGHFDVSNSLVGSKTSINLDILKSTES